MKRTLCTVVQCTQCTQYVVLYCDRDRLGGAHFCYESVHLFQHEADFEINFTQSSVFLNRWGSDSLSDGVYNKFHLFHKLPKANTFSEQENPNLPYLWVK